MNTSAFSKCVAAAVACGAIVCVSLLAQAPAAPAAGNPALPTLSGGFAAGTLTPGLALPAASLYRGTSKGLIDDIQLTAITRMEEDMAKELAAVPAAREALMKASLSERRNDADIKAKVDALSTAELALALKRAEGFASYQKTFKLTPQQVTGVATMIGTGSISVAGRGGRGN